MRQIDADNLIERIKAAPIRDKNKVIGLIHTERTAPVKTGKWIYEHGYYCSECGDFWAEGDREMIKIFNYCPNCGARMIEGREE